MGHQCGTQVFAAIELPRQRQSLIQGFDHMDLGGAEVRLLHTGDDDHMVLFGTLSKEVTDERTDGEIFTQILFPFYHSSKTRNLALGIPIAKALLGPGHQNNSASLIYHLQSIGEGFDGLIEVQIFRKAAGTGNYQRCLFLGRYTVHPVRPGRMPPGGR